MAKTGPQRYPGASTAYWYQGRYPGSAMESNVGVVHTTEGTTLPSYGGGASAPNFTAWPDIPNKRLRWYQHFDFDVSSRALVNLRGGVETNTLNAVQIELVGTCDPKHRTSWGSRKAGRDYLFWPDAPDWALAELGKLVRWAHDHHGIRMQSTVKWKPYPSSYGANGVRLTAAQWTRYYGWLGHQHVPENTHGDPGDLDFARVLEHAKGTASNSSSEESDMPISDADAKKIARAVWETDGIVDVPWGSDTNRTWKAESVLSHLGEVTRENRGRIKALQAEVGALTEVVTRLAQGGGLDAAEIQAAAEAGARAALAKLGDALTDTPS